MWQIPMVRSTVRMEHDGLCAFLKQDVTLGESSVWLEVKSEDATILWLFLVQSCCQVF